MRADAIVLADTIHAPGAPASAVAVVGDRIAAVGSRADADAWRGPATRVVDLGPATVVPGLIDSHVHPMLGVQMTVGPCLLGADADRIASLLRAEASSIPRGGWLIGWGLEPLAVPMHRRFLDELAPGLPVVLRLFDGHGMLVSTEALRRAGIDGPRAFGDGSVVECDADGPTGVLQEMEAMALIDAARPALAPGQLAARIRDRLGQMAAQGITAVQAMEHHPGAGEAYSAIEAAGGLPVRISAAPWCPAGTGPDDWKQIEADQGLGGERWRIAGVKLFIDGTIDNGTAWLRAPDTLGQSIRGVWPDPADYAAAIAYFDSRGVSTATHAIGDRGVEAVLDAVAATQGRARHRIEHVETLPDDLLARFAASGVIASMQPTHCTEFTKPDQTDNWSVRLGHERASLGWRFGDLRRAGVTVALGSDWPIADHDPRGILASALLRRPAGRPDVAPTLPRQALDPAAALDGYTRSAALAMGDPDLGSIEVGKRAALTAFALDPLTADPDEFAESAVLLTMVDGQEV